MFVTLGLLVYPSEILPVIGPGILIALFLIFVARPLAVLLALSFFVNLNIRKKLFISWVGLRGAVPIVFATYPLLAGVQAASTIFNLVFFISVSSILLQGTMLPIVARWLHVSVPEKIKRKFPLDIELKDNFNSELVELDIPADSSAVGKAVMQLGLPKSALIVLIHRDKKYITANGDTEIMPRDHLLVMADTRDTVNLVYECFNIKPS
jgi:potassium/hydrogen antiporter